MPRILIVEDEPLIAMTLEDMLDELGYEVAGTASRVDEALALIGRDMPDGAVLDVNLGREKIDPVADLLQKHNCPFIFATGDGRAGLPVAHEKRPFVAKPFRLLDLEQALKAAIPVRSQP